MVSSEVVADTIIDLRAIDQYFDDFILDVEEVSLITGKYDEYTFSNSVTFNAVKKQLTLRDLQFTPQYSREAYSHILEEQSDYYEVSAKEVLVHDFQLRRLFQPSFNLSKVDLVGVQAEIYRDKNVPRINRPTPLVQGQLKEIKSPFLIDTLQIIDSYVGVAELPEDALEPSYLFFSDLNGSLLHITNEEEHFDQPMILTARCRFFGEGDFYGLVRFNMQDSLNSFDLHGQMSEMDLRLLNQLVTPQSRLQINSGKNRRLRFNIAGNHHRAIGEMEFKYNKLKFQIVNKDDHNKVNFGNSMSSFFANRLVKSNNPALLNKRMGIVYYERDKEKAIFNFWGKSILSGLISSVGVRSNKKRLKHMTEEQLEELHYKEIFRNVAR